MNLPIPTHPAQIMSKPDTLRHLTDAYFGLTQVPTPAGLAVHLGFTSVPQLIRAAEDPAHPQESRDLLATALTLLEDALTQSGLTERTHPAFTKYILTARLNVVEPKQNAEDRAPIQISIKGLGQVAIGDLI